MSVYCGKMADSVEMLSRIVTRVGSRNRVLDGCAHWCHLANMVQQLCMAAVSGFVTIGADVSCYHITLGDLVTKYS